ncbi:MAG: hypothetical protein KC656_24580 [Myxococcales bacterium]|nr:hypothetical protein [Myxococcales bacterium]
MRWLATGALLALAAGCRSVPHTTDTPNDVCDGYPAGATRPMTEGEVLYPYSWPEAVDIASGTRVPLDLGQAPCDTDPNIDWSPFDVLLFVSIPAW